MELFMSADDIMKGATIIERSARSVAAIRDAIAGHIPIALGNPYKSNAEATPVSIILPMNLKSLGGAKHELKFKPIALYCYKVCHIRSTQLNALVIETPLEQRTFSASGDFQSYCRMRGPGCDPKLVADSETGFADLLKKEPDNKIVRAVANYLFQKAKEGKL